MPDQASLGPTAGQVNPAELAEALEDLSEQLAKVVPSTTDSSVRSVLTDCLERLRRIGSGLRAMALVVDPKRAQELAEREKDLRGLVSNIGESIRGVAEANRSVAVKMEDQIRELDEIVKLPPGEEAAKRLRKTVVTVRDAATSMEKSLQKLVTQVEDANSRIARLERELEEARERALYDALTRVHSRAALDERLLRAVRDRETGGPWCFMIADIDHFKAVNDKHGHIVGDALLYKIARVMEQTLQERAPSAFLARYGGEEFSVILPNSTITKAAQIAELMRTRIQESRWQVRTKAGAPVLQATMSFGITQFREGDTVSSLIDRADRALYQAKDAGRNRVVASQE